MALLAILLAAVNSVGDIKFFDATGIGFDSTCQIMPKRQNAGQLCGKDLAWLYEGVLERKQAAKTVNNLVNYQPFSKAGALLTGNPIKIRQLTSLLSEDSGSEYGGAWLTRFCADPTLYWGLRSETRINPSTSWQSIAGELLGTGFSDDSRFAAIPVSELYEASITSNTLVKAFNNLRWSNRFVGSPVETFGGLGSPYNVPELCEGTETIPQPSRSFCNVHWRGHYATADTNVNDWVWMKHVSVREIQPITIRDVPAGASCAIAFVISTQIQSRITDRDSYIVSYPTTTGNVIQVAMRSPKSVSTSSAVGDVTFPTSWFFGSTGAIADTIITSFFNLPSFPYNRYDPSKVIGDYRTKRRLPVGGMPWNFPDSEAIATSSILAIYVIVDLGHTKWW